MRLLFFTFLLNLTSLFSQTENKNFCIEYEMTVLVGNKINSYNSKLTCNNEQSLFSFRGKFENNTEEKSIESKDKSNKSTEINIIKTDSSSTFIYTNRISNILQTYNNKNVLNDSIPDFNWKIESGEKTINNILCNKATITYSGRDYEVWFTYEIPITFGPYKFHNLPGAILELRDLKNEVIINAIRIEQCNQTINTPKFDELNYVLYNKNTLISTNKKQLSKIEKKNKQLKKEFISNASKDIKINSIEIKTQNNKFIELLD